MDKIESREDYLEAILQLSDENHLPKSIDVANKLGFSKPSISIAMKKLKEDKLIEIDEKGYIHLTSEGHLVALKTLEKHEYLKSFFISIGVDEVKAEDTACKIEHSIDEDTFNKIKNYIGNK